VVQGAAALACCDAGDYGRGWAGKQASKVCLSHAPKAEQQADDRAAPPEHEGVERQKPERGLTFDMSGSNRLAG